jgi:hypothetical protein
MELNTLSALVVPAPSGLFFGVFEEMQDNESRTKYQS